MGLCILLLEPNHMKPTTYPAKLPLTTLSSILTTIATVRDRTTLLKTIIAELQPLFGFHDVGLFIVHEEEDYHIDLAVDMPQISPSDAAFALYEVARGKLAHQGSVIAWTMAQVEAAGEPLLFDFGDLKKRFPDYPQWIEISDNYRDCLVTTLKVQGELMGVFCINAQEKDKFAKVDRTLFQLIADQLAVVLSNLLVNEQLLAEKQFKETLLGISEAVASIQDRKQLLKTIYQRIAPIFPYDAYGLFILTEDKQYHYELIDAEVMDYEPSQVAIEQQFGAHHRYPHPDSPVADVMQRGPGLFLVKDYINHTQGPIMYEAGLRQLIGGPLTYGGKPIGMLCFNSKQENFYTEQHLPLFEAIAEQLSVAVSNVLANEAVLSEKAKVERLHLVSEVMSRIQHRHQLALAFDRIRSVFPFDNAGLFVLDDTGQQHYELLDSETLNDDPVQQGLEQQYGKHAYYPHADSPVAHLMQAGEVGLYSAPALLRRYPDYPQSAAVRAAGFQQIIAAPLRQGNQVIGLLNFNSKRADQYSEADFPLVRSIAEQMSTVVSNILTNEREQEQRRFKETLLSISEAVASIQDRRQLLKVILERIQPIFDFHDAGVFVLDASQQFINDWAVDFPEISPSSGNLALAGQQHGSLTYPGSVLAWSLENAQRVGGPVVYNYQELWQRFPDWPFFSVMEEVGYQDGLSTVLKVGGKALGLLCFNSLEVDHFSQAQFPLFQAIADQLAVAVSNVLANERLLEEKQFKETLLSITEAVASIQNRAQLLKVVFKNIQPVLPFDAPGLFIIDRDQHYEMLDQEITGDQHNKHVWQAVGVGPFANQGTIIQDVIATQETRIIPINRDMHPHGEAMLASGLQQEIYGPLKNGGQVIGMFCLNSRQQNQYRATDLPLFQAIADQLAVAVSNVLANERLVAEKQFKETLLSISEAVASVQGKKELFRVIISKLKPLFGFDSVGLFVVNQKEDYHVDWAADMPDIDESKGNQVFFEQNIVGKLPHNNSTVAWAMQQCVAQNGPVLQDFTQVPTHFSDHHALAIIIEIGHREWLFTNLMVQGEVIGMFCINFFEKGNIRQEQFPLFQAIADQLAVAVSNVLANEHLVEEKQFKETLLSITEAVASIQNRADLFRTVVDKIQPVFPFDELGIFVNDESGQYQRDLAVDDQFGLIQDAYPIGWLPRHPSVERFMRQGPMIQSLAQLMAQDPDHPHYPRLQSEGLSQVIGGPLHRGGQPFAMLCFWSKQGGFYTEADFPLFQAISNQLAVAVSNVLANERLVEEKKKTEDLLTVTEAIANINSGPELVRAIFDKLQRVFPFNEAGLFHLDFERQRERDLIVDYGYDTTVSSAQLKEQGLSGWLPLQKVTLYFVNQGPSFMSTEELFATFDHPHFNEHTKSFGFKQVIASPLKKGDETIGLLYFWSKTDHFFNGSLPLFKSISDQLSVALSNILANEDIRRREQENALQVAVVNALNSGSSWEEKLLGVARHLQAYVPFDLMTVALSEERPDRLGYAVERIGHEEYRLLSAEAFLRLTQLSVLRYQELRSQHTYSDIFVANGDDFVECCQQDPIKRAVARAFSMQANLTVPLPLSRRGHFQLAFYCKSVAGYQPAHQQLMRKIVPSLTLALEKLVAYDEIRELNARLSQEKTYLEEEIKTHYNFGQIVGESPALQAVFTQIGQVAATDSTVLLLGETGTGKELVARALHEGSPRQRQSLIKINCAALPSQLIESELFGHERGAFTGAVQRRIGKFELADSSTIFLDEIGELPMELQSKLLRVLQEKEFERLGSNQVRRADARVVAATNRDLEEEVREGRFRQDLYYRLNVFPIYLPPLRERIGDLPLLATFFVQKYTAKFKKRLLPLTNAQLRELTRYSWPGNVRELEHLIERAVIQANGQIGILNIPISLPSSNALATFLAEDASPKAFAPRPWKDTEVEILINTLRYCGGKVRGEGGAAQLLGLHPNTLESRMKKLDIRRQHVIDQGKG